jgi:hypothetical protein
MKLNKSILMSIMAVVISSCSPAILTPDVGIEIQPGRYLEVTAPKGWNSYKTDELISLMIRNVSENQITAANDFGARIFIRQDQEWTEVKNKIIYETGPFTLDPDKNYTAEKLGSTAIMPELTDYSVPYYIRVFIFGILIENGKESEKVGSYVDLRLNP